MLGFIFLFRESVFGFVLSLFEAGHANGTLINFVYRFKYQFPSYKKEEVWILILLQKVQNLILFLGETSHV
jgi:hypothetical protein